MNTFKRIVSLALIVVSASTAEAANRRPVVNAGANQQVNLGTAAQLAGRATDDGLPRGQRLRIQWHKVSGPGTVGFSNSRSAATTATFSRSGNYVLSLRANDGQLVGEDTVRVRVVTPPAQPDRPQVNEPPTVDAGLDQQLSFLGSGMQINLGGSVLDLDGPRPLTLNWRQVEGPAQATLEQPTRLGPRVTFSQAGRYRFVLEAFDGVNRVSDDVMVQVDPPSGNASAYLRRVDVSPASGYTQVRLYNDHPSRQIDFRIRYLFQFSGFLQPDEGTFNFTVMPGNYTIIPPGYLDGGFVTFIEVNAAFH
jgi:hypothetical protein